MKLDARAGVGTVAASIRTAWGGGGGAGRRVDQSGGGEEGGGGDADRKRYLDSMM